MKALSYVPHKGYSTVPSCSEAIHPNLVIIYVDVQHDYLQDRVYLLGARVVAHAGGLPQRARNIVCMTDGPPDSPQREETLMSGFVRAVLEAVTALAAPDARGEPRAPIHVVCWGAFVRQLLLDALARCFAAVAETAPAVYDLLTQIAPEEAPFLTLLEEEIRRINCPSVCQTLQSIASYYRFQWNRGERYRHIFREHFFDAPGKTEQEVFYTRRARFDSQFPLDYAYVAWGQVPPAQGWDGFHGYRGASRKRLLGLMRRQVEAVAWITQHLQPQALQRKSRQAADLTFPPIRNQREPLLLTDLDRYSNKAGCLSDAMREFILIERNAALGAWRSARHAAPEQRMLAGLTLLAEYYDADQPAGVAQQNRDSAEAVLQGRDWHQADLCFRLRLRVDGTDCGLEDALAMTEVSVGDRLVICPRLVCDQRLPPQERTWRVPSPQQMLYGARAELLAVEVDRGATGAVTSATAIVQMHDCFGSDKRFQCPSAGAAPFEDGALYTLDLDPNDAYAQQQNKVVEELRAIENGQQEGRHALYERLVSLNSGKAEEHAVWPGVAAQAQALFVDGLVAARLLGLLPDELDELDREYISSHGGDPVLLVQGPPGTGKSTKSALKVLAHLQGAMAVGTELRVYLCANTHSATDVLLTKVAEKLTKLCEVRAADPALFARYFDARLTEIPLFRAAPAGSCPVGVTELPKAHNKGTRDSASNVDVVRRHPWCVVAATPGGVYGLFRERWTRKTFHAKRHCGLLILDETSRMTLLEAMLAALPLHPEGQVVIIGDHRQMPPITQHDWARERRRTFREYKSFLSLYEGLLPLELPHMRFSRTYRCHEDIVAFLQHAFYRADGIQYHSRQTAVLPVLGCDDPFIAAVLTADCPLTLIVHGEHDSETKNLFELRLLAPIIETLTDSSLYNLDADTGLGIVAVHRDQRAALQRAHPHLASAINTVEKYQGDERDVILISATESDSSYLLDAGEFLLDPRRLCVALSRARKKVVLVVSQSVFSLISTDEVLWQALQVWQHLLRTTCTRSLWTGNFEGYPVRVWGNHGEGQAASE